MSYYTAEHSISNWGKTVPEDLPKTMNYFRKAAEGEPQNYEVAILRKDGSRVELNVTNVPIVVNDRIVGVYGVAKDITERKRVEVALKRSEESAKKLADENAAIAQIGRIISSSMNIEEVYEEFKKEVGRLISFERIAINMVDAEDGNLDSPYVAGIGVPGRKEAEVISLAGEGAEWVLQNRLSLLLGKENWREIAGLFPGLRPIFRAGFKTCMIVALISGGRVIGILSFLSIRPDAYCEDDLKLAERIGSQISRAIDNAQLFLGSMRAEEELKKSRDQLRALAEHLQSVREEDRTRIARWIHDEVGQALTRIGVDLWGLAADSPKEKQSLKGKIESISKFVGATMELVRRMSTELRPSVLDFGLVAALEWQAQEFQNRTGIQCECQVSSDEVNLPGDHSTAVFRIFQEILTNVVRHAKASRVAVALKRAADSVVLEVKDNGRGISQSEISDPKALGLLGMRERAILFGGEVNFISVPGRGTTVVVRIPLKSER
jgi:signal transduction histidine kinase